MILYGVFGRPILHSKSPICHAHLVKPRTSSYVRVLAETAEDLVRTASSANFRGFNVTAPFKQSLLPYLDELDASAVDVGAVNTVVREGGGWKGFNTDGAGMLFCFRRRGIDVTGLRCIVLGAGGAGRAAAAALVRRGAHVTVVNRTGAKAKALAASLGCSSGHFQPLNGALREADLIVNTVPLDPRFLQGLVLPHRPIILDGLYHLRPFLRVALCNGCSYIAGEEWLFGQALDSFSLFEGKRFQGDDLPLRIFEPVFPPEKRRRVSLVGFMGAGKTTVGRLLARKLQWPFLETDRLIVATRGSSIPEIFRRDGEAVFRKAESEAVEHALRSAPAVVSVGGGALLRRETRYALKSRSLVVWIHVDPETALRRIQESDRPLLKEYPDGQSFHHLWKERQAAYAAAADLMIGGDILPEKITRLIYEEIRRLPDS